MKERYIELMEKTLSAYTEEHIIRYFDDVKRDGLTEHGFPRLTSNIGILIAHGRRKDLLPIFLEMMDFCCVNIPKVKAANDFSVREIICCVREIEQSQVVEQTYIDKWKSYLAGIDPLTCYTVIAHTPEDKVKNWALFTGVSEFFRQDMGLCDSTEFIDTQLASQFQWFDENGMYMDHTEDIHHPMTYDLVPRGLFCLLLNQGYNGKYREKIDSILKKAGILTLKMQSPNGEVPFGGRSNQFLNNEAWLCLIFEYEAKRYAKEGNTDLALRFKSASVKSLSVIEYWLSKSPIRHIKNCFETETKYGCESYAYFDKYMITVASFLYGAYQICDESIPARCEPDLEPSIFVTSYHFHKLFMKCGGYGLEFDLNADTHYEANGLGRIHKDGAPSTICLSTSCPENPGFYTDIPETPHLSLCSTVVQDGIRHFGSETKTEYKIIESKTNSNSVTATLLCKLDDSIETTEKYTVSENGVEISVSGKGEIGYILPAFDFDGKNHTKITLDEHNLTIEYENHICKYTTDEKISDLNRISANRNGHYLTFVATSRDKLNVKVEIVKII